MVTLLISSLFFLAAFAIAAYFWQRPRLARDSEYRLGPEPPRFAGLFAEPETTNREAADEDARGEFRKNLLARAEGGDRTALREAVEFKNDSLYAEVLESLILNCDNDQKLFALTSYIARSHDLRVNSNLAEAFLECWRRSPERLTVAEMLHVTALSDSAALYQSACEQAVERWHQGRLPAVQAEDLSTLIESEFWVLSASARSSGAGFVLKRSIGELRRQLVSTNNA